MYVSACADVRQADIALRKKLAEKNKLIKDFGDAGQVLNGRYGPYVKLHGINIKIPKDQKPEELTLEQCEKLYEEQKDKPKRGRGKAKKK